MDMTYEEGRGRMTAEAFSKQGDPSKGVGVTNTFSWGTSGHLGPSPLTRDRGRTELTAEEFPRKDDPSRGWGDQRTIVQPQGSSSGHPAGHNPRCHSKIASLHFRFIVQRFSPVQPCSE